MDPITTLRGYLLSRLLHGIRILLLTTTVSFICHDTAIAKNKPDKTLSSEDDGGGGRGYLRSIHPLQQIESSNVLSNTSTHFDSDKKNYLQSSSNNEITADYSYTYSKPSTGGDKIEHFSLRLESYHILQTVQTNVGASNADMNLFTTYYHDKIYGDDRSAYWHNVEQGIIATESDIKQYAEQKITEYTALYKTFEDIKKNYPSTINERQSHSSMGTCNPACDNIDFENSTLSAWSAYYEQNTSSTTVFSNTAPTGGACGAVKYSAYDPNTTDYQVSLTSGAGLDPVAGALIPIVCPTGGKYSVRIGDSTRNGAQMGILEQSFNVTAANANFTYMYAVVLENPGHSYYQQPYFNVEILDAAGNPIANCGNYSVVSGPGLQGYTAIYYAPDNDTVYCKPWTTVFVPLQAYIGQCITLKLTASDCALGGHFGYAYFDATCSPGIISSSPAICGNNITLTAPAGAATYQWLGPCIVGSSTGQTITVGCAGIYKVAVTSIANSGCSDTIVDTVKGSTPPVLTATGTNVKCNGASTGSAVAIVTGGTKPYQYTWSNGRTTSTISALSAGTYKIKLVDANGCSDTASVTITQPTAITATPSSLPVSCNGGSTGSSSVIAGGGTPSYTYLWTPKGGTGSTASGLSAGAYTVTITDANGCTQKSTATVTQPTALSATTKQTNELCNEGNNGSATVTVSGGTPSYTYVWAPSGGTSSTATNLTAGIYTVTTTDANACLITATVTITQPSAVVATIPSYQNVSCHGGNNGSATASATGGTAPYTYLWSNGQKTKTSTGLTSGSYAVTVTDANGCTGTDSILISQPAQLVITITQKSVSCYGGTNGQAMAVVSGGTNPYSYSWNTIPVQTSSTATALSAGIFMVTVTDLNGCTNSNAITITQPTALTAPTSTLNVSCNGGNNGMALVVATGGIKPYNYTWTPKVSTSGVATNLSAGTYSITVTDSNGCSANTIAVISQPLSLATSVVSTTNVSCNGGNNGSIVLNTIGGSPTYTYTWTPNVSSSNSAANLTAGTYTIVTTDANACVMKITVNITQPATLTTTIASITNVSCYGGNNGVISLNTSGGSPSYTYAWTPNITTGATANNLTVGNYKVTITDANGCVNNINASISAPQPIKITSSTIEPLCNGMQNGSATITVFGGTPSYNAAWNTSPPQNGFTASNIGAGSYVATITDANGCLATDTVIVSQPPVLSATIPSSKNVTCYGDSNGIAGVYTTGGTTPYSYAWTTSPIQTTYDADDLSAGTYTVDVTDAHGCTTNAAVTISQPTPVITTASAPDSICSGVTVSIVAAASGGTGSYTYQWNSSSSTGSVLNVTPTTTTTYTVTAIDGNGCKGNPASVTINTWNLGPASLSVPPVQSVCYGDSATIYANVASGSGSLNIYWTNGFSGTGPFRVAPATNTTYTVTVSNQCGVSVTKTMAVNVNPLPVISIPEQTAASCGQVTFTYQDTAKANALDTYQWNFGDGYYSTANPASHSYEQSGTYTVTVIVTSPEGCISQAQAPANVTVYPTAIAKFTPTPSEAPIANPVITFIDASVNTTTWLWDFGDKSLPSYEQSPTHTYKDTGTYRVQLTANNTYGCPSIAVDSIRINPEFAFYIPNAFTPNGDKSNNYFTGKGIGITDFTMMIFDRWGAMIYQTTDMDRGWDGRVNGGNSVAQEDTYVYVIDIMDIFKQKHHYLGSVTLLK